MTTPPPPQLNPRRPRRTFGLRPVARKEVTHTLRDPTTLFFALLIPIIQLFLFGYAVDTNVRQLPTVLYDESHTQQSRSLIQAFAASDIFHVTSYVQSEPAMYATMRGIVLRGSAFSDLWINALVLPLMGTGAILLAARAFVKQGAS